MDIPDKSVFSALEDHETEALKELNDFLARPNSIGLDNLKESLRNMVQLMMEIKGYGTGYALQHLVNGEHSSIALEGILKGDAEKKRKIQELRELMEQFERLMAQNFEQLFDHVQNRISVINKDIKNQINKLDETIKSAIEDDLGKEVIDKKIKKLSMLKMFMSRIKKRENDLQEVEAAEEIIEVETDLYRDIEDFRNGTLEQPKPRPNPFKVIADIFRSRRSQRDDKAEYQQQPNYQDSGSDKDFNPDDTDKEEDEDEDSDSDDRDEDAKPTSSPNF